MNSDAFARVIYSESHDADANGHSRFGEEVTPGNAGSYLARKRTALAAALIMTAPGTPMLFQGQEFQEGGAFSHWAPLNWRNVETYAGIVDLYSHLIALRQNRHGNTAGLLGRHVDVFLQEDETKVIGFHRWDKAGAGDDVVVVANFANKKQEALEIAFPYVGTWRVRLNSDWSGYSSDFSDVGPETVEVEPSQGDSRRLVGKLDIGPYAVLILSSDK
jgi:1,4-alpha-glucan branching enzyme